MIDKPCGRGPQLGRILAGTIGVLVGLVPAALSQTVSIDVLHRFIVPYNSQFGAASVGEIAQGPDGAYYGVFGRGGPFDDGAIFKVTPNGSGGGTLSILHDFDGSDGAHPSGRLLLANDGNFYGVTTGGSGATQSMNSGTVFRIAPDGTFTTIHAFIAGEGFGPLAGLIQGADGSLYGTTATSAGSLNNGASVFKITLSGATTVLHTFNAQGDVPTGRLYETGGVLYGVTAKTIFSLDESSRSFLILHSFVSADGSAPNGGVIQATDGMFYGTMRNTVPCGSIYRVDLAGTLTTLYQFPRSETFSCSNGDGPDAGVIQGSDGRLYGTTDGFFSGVYGNAYAISLAGEFTVLHTFDGTDGGKPFAGLFQDSGGNIVGTTSIGSAAPNADGTVFSITPSGSFSTLTGFQSYDDGYDPQAGLVQGPDGSLYGTTLNGGAGGAGTIFKFNTTDGLTVLRHLSVSVDGGFPYDRLLLAADGNLYGTTSSQGGGAGVGFGTLFKVTPDGGFTRLYVLSDPDLGISPVAGLIEGVDGNLYGTTLGYGGGLTQGRGLIYRRGPDGTVSAVHRFAGGSIPPEGGYLYATLIQGLDGRLYGTARDGGLGSGTVFAVDPVTGTLTVLHAFTDGSDGGIPYGGLVQTADGTLYGTTTAGGTTAGGCGIGVIYRITTSGAFDVLHTFSCVGGEAEGAEPYGALILGRDGWLYGATRFDGDRQASAGTIFRVSTSGVFQVLHTFLGTDGANPIGDLMQGADGRFYGTTSGPAGGEIFALTVTDSTTLVVAAGTGSFGGSTALSATLASADGPIAGQTIAFLLNGHAVGSATTNASGSATLSGVSLAGIAAGAYPGAVEASFTGNATGLPSSGTAALTVTPAPTTTSIAASENPVDQGRPVQFTATVVGDGATGTVTFADGDAPLGSVALSGGVAIFTASALAAGTHSIVATYGGDANHESSASSPLIETVLAVPVVTLTTSVNPAVAGQPITFTITVAGTNLTNSVVLFDGAGVLATFPGASATDSFTTPNLSVGTHAIAAIYLGDSVSARATSPVLEQVVSPAQIATTTLLTSSANPSVAGQNVTFTATVAPLSGTAVPVGSVTFLDGASTLGTVPIGGGSASLTTSSLTTTTHVITARYVGSLGFAASSATINQSVNAPVVRWTAAAKAFRNNQGQYVVAITVKNAGNIAGFVQLASVSLNGTPARREPPPSVRSEPATRL